MGSPKDGTDKEIHINDTLTFRSVAWIVNMLPKANDDVETNHPNISSTSSLIDDKNDNNNETSLNNVKVEKNSNDTSKQSTLTAEGTSSQKTNNETKELVQEATTEGKEKMELSNNVTSKKESRTIETATTTRTQDLKDTQEEKTQLSSLPSSVVDKEKSDDDDDYEGNQKQDEFSKFSD